MPLEGTSGSLESGFIAPGKERVVWSTCDGIAEGAGH